MRVGRRTSVASGSQSLLGGSGCGMGSTAGWVVTVVTVVVVLAAVMSVVGVCCG